MYPVELEIKGMTESNASVSYRNLRLRYGRECQLYTSISSYLGRYGGLKAYKTTWSTRARILNDNLKLCLIQWHPPSLVLLSKSWPYYQAFPFTELREVSIEHLRRLKFAGRGRSLLRTPGPVPFGTCICSTCWNQYFFKACRDFLGHYFEHGSLAILIYTHDIRTVLEQVSQYIPIYWSVLMHSVLCNTRLHLYQSYCLEYNQRIRLSLQNALN